MLVSLIVVPHAGTWIEMNLDFLCPDVNMSFPTRERGLKLKDYKELLDSGIVVPHAGTWIEIDTVEA